MKLKRWIITVSIIVTVIGLWVFLQVNPLGPKFLDDKGPPECDYWGEPYCRYKEHEYFYIDNEGSQCYWDFDPSWFDYLTDFNFIGLYPSIPFGVGAGVPLVATKEDIPEFIVFDEDHYVYMREDIDLGSIYKTAFREITVIYGRSIKKNEQSWIEYPAGTTFTDIVGETPIIYTRSGNNIQQGDGESDDVAKVTYRDIDKNYSYYAKLRCYHPEYKYIFCDLPIVIYDGNYYLHVSRRTEDYEAYYLLDDPFDNGGETAGADDAGEK